MQSRIEQIVARIATEGWRVTKASEAPVLGVEVRKPVATGQIGRGRTPLEHAYVIMARGEQLALQVVDDSSALAGFSDLPETFANDDDVVARVLGPPTPWAAVLEEKQRPTWDAHPLGTDIAFGDEDDDV